MNDQNDQQPEAQPAPAQQTVFPFPFGSTFSDDSSESSAPEQGAEAEKE